MIETRSCQNCKQKFEIVDEDFNFYKKIDVPPPTWCSECRQIRRMIWGFDVRTLYPRQCQAPGHSEKIYSTYPPETKSPLYDQEYYKSDAWDPRDYGKEYDFSRSFFEQWKELLDRVPVRNLEIKNSINCEYCKSGSDCKDCYFCSGLYASEGCMYCHTGVLNRECVDANLCTLDERCSNSLSLDKSFKTTNSFFSEELLNCDFMYDCRNCSDCLGCVGLRSKQYCIFNVQYSKKDYERERAKYDLGSWKTFQEVKARHDALIHSRPRKYAITKNAVNCTGDNILDSKNAKFSFQVLDNVEDSKYIFVAGRGLKNGYDISGAGLKCDYAYELLSVTGSQRTYFSSRIYNCHDVYYSRDCQDSSYLFGCVGLKDKSYYIFNRAYSKEEYGPLVEKIKKQMAGVPYVDTKGRIYSYGEFPPPEHSPLFYNDAWVVEYYPLSKEEAINKGFSWRDQESRAYSITLQSNDLPDHISKVSNDILGEVIGCAHNQQCKHNCPGAFRLLAKELEFYRNLNIPLPRICPNCRFSEHLTYLTPYKLWKRQCMCQSQEAKEKGHSFKNTVNHFHSDVPCQNIFETAYAPERKELLYCESCYNSEVA